MAAGGAPPAGFAAACAVLGVLLAGALGVAALVARRNVRLTAALKHKTPEARGETGLTTVTLNPLAKAQS